MPLITSVSSYLLVQYNHEKQHRGDPTFFIADETQEMHRVQSIRNQCLTLVSSLIEVFGDMAVQAVLLVVHNMQKPQAPGTGNQNPWLAKFNMAGAAGLDDDDSDQDGENEESKVDSEQAREE